MKIRIEIEIDDRVADYHWHRNTVLPNRLKARQKRAAKAFFNHVVKCQLNDLNEAVKPKGETE